ncbi:MAG TPA: hypothetical protein VHC95_03330 [Opitutales bacterium]|nr:hypothetical protein [Opitutales bacterium]
MSLPPVIAGSPQEKTDGEQLQLLAIFHFIYAGMGVFGILFLFVHHGIMTHLMTDPRMRQDYHGNLPPEQLIHWFDWFYVFMGLYFVVSMVLNVGSGLFLRQRSHRLFSQVTAGLNCLHFPFGTALGVFTFIVLSRDSVRTLYAEARQSANFL